MKLLAKSKLIIQIGQLLHKYIETTGGTVIVTNHMTTKYDERQELVLTPSLGIPAAHHRRSMEAHSKQQTIHVLGVWKEIH